MDGDANDFLLVMKVILRSDVKGVGKKGDLKNIADGYALNALFPKKLAVAATADSIRHLEQEEKKRKMIVEKELSEAKALGKKISSMTFTLVRRAEKGKLFGAIHEGDIVEAFATEKIAVEKKQVFFEKQIKEIGSHSIGINLGHGIQASFTIIIKAG